MGKIGNTLLMLKLLNGGKKYTIKELSEIIEVSPRQIRTYKEELEKAGIYIETISGRYGGYYYPSKKYDFNIYFNIYEINTLEKIYMLIKDSKDKRLTDNLSLILEKMRYIVLYSNDTNGSDYNKNYYNTLSNAIKDNIDVILITNNKDRTFRPHSIYINNDNYYVTGYCYDVKDLRTFSFSEIDDINF